MKILNMFKNASNSLKKIGMMLGMSFFSVAAFAADDDGSISNLGAFRNIINTQAGMIFKITIVIATLAGVILIIKGLVHLKQNYTGTGQEKHLSKGIASLGFGTALILAVPLTHTLAGSIDASTSFNTGAGTVDFDKTT